MLAGSVAFVTGIARGQGRAHALALAAHGADIVGLDRAAPVETMDYPMSGTANLDDVRREIEALGRRVMVSAIDVRDRAGVESLLARAVSEWGRLDIVAANAGVSPPAGDVSSISHDRERTS